MSTTKILDHFEDIKEFEDILGEAEANASGDWETEFVDSISTKFDIYAEGLYLSEAQANRLRTIAGRQ